MAHFAEIDNDGLVTRVLVTDNSMPKEGLDWLKKTFGGTWIKTSYNTYNNQHILGGKPIRKNFAGVGFSYDKARDAFIPPQPYSSWLLNEETCNWEAPILYPEDEQRYLWDEAAVNWVAVAQGEPDQL
jgi:hypothetical protein